MNRPGLSTVSDWIRWGAGRIGAQGRIGLALTLLTALVCLFLVRPLVTELGEMRARADRIAGDLARHPPELARADPEQDWLARLPASHAGHAHLARLFAAAESAGLRLDEGRYRESKDAGSGVSQLSISLPVNGGYPAIRAFLSQALAREPGLALEGLRLFRDEPGEREIGGELRFVLFLGSKP